MGTVTLNPAAESFDISCNEVSEWDTGDGEGMEHGSSCGPVSSVSYPEQKGEFPSIPLSPPLSLNFKTGSVIP